MLLSPIFLALGAVATSVLNSGGRFAAAALAPIVYNLAIIGGAILLVPSFGVEGLAIGVVAGSLGHLLVQLRPLARLGFRYTPADRRRRSARHARRSLLMAPRAIGLGATQITFIVVTALATTARHRRRDGLQLRVRAAPDPARGHRRPARDRRPADAVARRGGRARGRVRGAPDPGAAAARLRHGPDRRADRDRPRNRSSRCCSGAARSARPNLDLIAIDPGVLPDRADRARADRGPRSGVLRAPGHGHAGPRRGRRRRHQLHAWPSSSSDRTGCRASPWRSPIAAWIEASPCSSILASPPAALRAARPGPRRHRGRRRQRRSPGRSRSCAAGWSAGAIGADPGRLVLVVEVTLVSLVFGARLRRALARVADPGTAVYRRGHGRRAPPPAPGRDGRRSDAPGTRSSRRATPARTSSCPRGPRSRPSTAGTAHRIGAGRRRPRSAPRSSSAGLDRCRGASPTPRAGRSPRDWTPEAIGAFTAAVRDGLPAAAGRVSHLRIDPEIEADGPLDPDGALRRALRAAGWRPAPPIQPNATRIIDLRPDEEALWGDLRKKWRQYVNKARTAGITVVDADGDRLGEFYRIYRETADRAGFLIRTESAYRDVWEAFAPERPRPAPVRADARRRAAGDALPRALRAAGRRAVRRDDRGRRRVARQLPAQVGGHPLVARGRAPRATTCGVSRRAGSPTSRPGSGVARSSTSGHGTSSSSRSAGGPTRPPSASASGGRAGAAGSGPAGVPRRTGRPIEASATRTPDELADWDACTVEAPGGHVYQSRAWADASERLGLAAAVPRR